MSATIHRFPRAAALPAGLAVNQLDEREKISCGEEIIWLFEMASIADRAIKGLHPGVAGRVIADLKATHSAHRNPAIAHAIDEVRDTLVRRLEQAKA